jgi:dTDP-4-amino-4,6-dideoxygalactose transaminase
MRVARYDYPAQFGADVDDLVRDVKTMLLSGEYILTAEVARFEREFAASLGAARACGLNSGTDALLLALRALDVGPGDEVITQANTFYATAAAIVFAGATPVLVDADDRTFLMDVDRVEAAVTPRTRVLLPVHLYGKPTPMARLQRIASDHGLAIVEDAAQAHGARIEGRSAGTFGAVGCFSFHPSKNLAAAGDGGAVVTDSEAIAAAIEVHRNLGQRGQNHHVALGINSKLDAIQARVLRWKLPRLESWVAGRNAAAAQYRAALDGLPVTWQRVSPDETHAYHLFQIRTHKRDELLDHLLAMDVDVVTRYPTPIHLQAPFERFGWRRGQFPIAESLADELLCLPIRPGMPEAEIDYVAASVRSFFEKDAARRAVPAAAATR